MSTTSGAGRLLGIQLAKQTFLYNKCITHNIIKQASLLKQNRIKQASLLCRVLQGAVQIFRQTKFLIGAGLSIVERHGWTILEPR